MTSLAFYAPMKPPTHAVPSGDRAVARSLIRALGETGSQVTLASELRVYDKRGDPDTQSKLAQLARAEADQLINRGRAEGWKAWITYHNYYKAPDLIGPQVTHALGLPYMLVEATRARKRLNGAWSAFAQAAEAACDAADTIFYMTERDAIALRSYAPPAQTLQHLRPFLATDKLPTASTRQGAMLSVGMMRPGDKLASYALIKETLEHMIHPDWRLDIAGDGPARDDVCALMTPFGDRVRFLGELGKDALAQRYAQASLLLWPGVNEAFGMSYLEAQAAGLPVVAQDRPGVRDVLAPGVYPAVEAGPAALAARADQLLGDPAEAQRAAQSARDHIRQFHLIDTACDTLRANLQRSLS